MGLKNFVQDYGAPTNGNDLCTTAVLDWLTYARANPGSSLYIPDAAHGGADQYNLTNIWLDEACKDVTIYGDASRPALIDTLFGMTFAMTCEFSTSARVYTAKAGQTYLTLKTPEDVTKFSNGQWVLLGGLGCMSESNPVCPQYFEYVQIDTIDGLTLNLKTPLYRGYLDTWPTIVDLGNPTIDSGGPATIYGISGTTQQIPGDSGIAAWDTTVTYRSLTIAAVAGAPTVHPIRKLVFDDCLFTGSTQNGNQTMAISQCQLMEFRNCDCNRRSTFQFEYDKVLSRCIFDNCTDIGLYVQGLSDITEIRNGSTITVISGTNRRMVIKDSSFTTPDYVFHFGPGAFGATDNVYIENTEINDTSQLMAAILGVIELSAFGSPTDGILTCPRTLGDGIIQFTVPGHKLVVSNSQTTPHPYKDDSGVVHSFTITDLTGDDTNIYIHTDIVGSSIPNGLYGTLPGDIIIPYGSRSIIQVNSGPFDISAVTDNWHGPVLDPTHITPRVAFISPSTGSGGTAVTISGDYFSGVTDVSFGGQSTPSFTVVDDSTIVATAPVGVGAVHITLTDSNGSSSPAPVTYDDGTGNLATSDLFSYQNQNTYVACRL